MGACSVHFSKCSGIIEIALLSDPEKDPHPVMNSDYFPGGGAGRRFRGGMLCDLAFPVLYTLQAFYITRMDIHSFTDEKTKEA